MNYGHVAHKNCLINFYKVLDDKKRLIIPRCQCGQIPYHECVKDLAQKWIDYDQKINEQIKMRILLEDTKNDEHVKNPNDKDYFGNPEKFARDKHPFFIFVKSANIRITQAMPIA